MKRLLTMIICAAIMLSACAGGVSEPTEAPTAAPTAAPTEAPTEPPTEAPTQPPLRQRAKQRLLDMLYSKLSRKSVMLDVPEIDQFPELPAGCESVALTIAFNYYGCDLGKTEIASDYMVYGDDMITSYVGDPFNWGGAGIYPPGLVTTSANVIRAKNAQLYAFDTSGNKLQNLYHFIDNGVPVVVWTTVYMTYPQLEGGTEYNGRTYCWYDNEHCVCLCGYDLTNNTVSFSDPEQGIVTADADEFEEIFSAIGNFSLVLIPTKGL